jgi:hypothetical protein
MSPDHHEHAAAIQVLERLLHSALHVDETLEADMHRLGGWRGLCREWDSAGGAAASFARLWALTMWMLEDAELFADRMSAQPAVFVEFASRIQMLSLAGRVAEAERLLAAFCRETAQQWAKIGANDLSSSWLGHAELFEEGRLALSYP